MIEQCSDLLQCNNVLSLALRQVSLIGDLQYSPRDLARLTELVRAKITPDIHEGTLFLERKASACLACLLVWIGIEGHEGNSYWPAVRANTGLDDPNWQSRWGQIFLEFLRSRGLPLFEIEGSTSYVTPILCHGGIPLSCLPQFFDRILLPLVERDLGNLANPSAVLRELKLRRDDESERQKAEADVAEAAGELQNLRALLHRREAALPVLRDIKRLQDLEADAIACAMAADLAASMADFQRDCEPRLEDLDAGLTRAAKQREECEKSISAFDEKDRRLLEAKIDIHHERELLAETRRALGELCDLESDVRRLSRQLTEEAQLTLTSGWRESEGPALTALVLDDVRAVVDLYLSNEAEGTQLRLEHSEIVAKLNREKPTLLCTRSGLVGLFARLLGIGRSKQLAVQEMERQATKMQRLLTLSTSEQHRQQSILLEFLRDLPIKEEHLLAPGHDLIASLERVQSLVASREKVSSKCAALAAAQKTSRRRIVGLASKLGVESTEDEAKILLHVEEAIRVAAEHNAVAQRAFVVLEGHVLPRITELTAQRAALINRREELRERLVFIGEGDPERGKACAEQARVLQDAAARSRLLLSRRVRNLPGVEKELATRGLAAHLDELAGEIEKKRVQTDELVGRLQALESEREHLVTVWSGVDEPIRRYLLYGGESAERFLIGAVALYARHKFKDKETISETVLPARIVDAFSEWLRQRNAALTSPEPAAPVDPEVSHGQAPLVYLDAVAQEILVRLPSQPLAYMRNGCPIGVVFICNGQEPLGLTYPLRLYRKQDGATQTQELELPLSIPASEYRLHFTIDGKVVNSWSWPGVGEKQCLVFSGASGQLLTSGELPRERIVVVLHRDFRLEPGSCVVETAPMYGAWFQFTQLTVEPAELEALHALHNCDDSRSFSLTVAHESHKPFGLLGGSVLGGVTSNGRPVYSQPPQQIRAPIQSEFECRSWHLEISSNGGQQTRSVEFRLNQLRDLGAVRIADSSTTIELLHDSLLGLNSVGAYDIHLRKLPHRDWACSFVVLPGFATQFEPPLCPPYTSKKAPVVRALITHPAIGEVGILAPARVTETRTDCVTAEIPPRAQIVQGWAQILSERLPLSISIPKVRWRLQGPPAAQGIQWHDHAVEEEYWLEDWQGMGELALIANVPSGVVGELALGLDIGDTRIDRRAIRQGTTRFDLLAFRDSMRAGPAVHELRLSLNHSLAAFGPVPLMQVRWLWEVVALECVQESSGLSTVLKVSWQELGKAGGRSRLIRLWWPDETSGQLCAEVKVPPGELQAEFRLHSSQVPPNKYLLQFLLEDQWSGSVTIFPQETNVNCYEINIVRKDELNEGRLLGIRGVRPAAWARCVPPDELTPGTYGIRIVGRIINRQLPPMENASGVFVARTNEGWYVGHLEVASGRGLEGEMIAANPIKFEYDDVNRAITAIEDRTGDGAMYCRECRRLFWSSEMLKVEERRKHPLEGPVEHFQVEWR